MKKWTYEKGELYLGDCLKVMRKLPKRSVDLVVGSPPYEDARSYNIDFNLKGQDWVDWMVEVVKASLRVSRGLVAFVVGHGKKGATNWSAAPALLIADLHRAGICLRNPAIYKREGIFGSGGPDWFKANYEWIVCATHGGRLPWANNKAEGHRPLYAPGGKSTHRLKDGTRVRYTIQPRGYVNGDVDLTTKKPERVLDFANPGLVIDCGAVGGRHLGSQIAHENEAPYPEKVPRRFIRSFCPPNGIVLDPFVGSGTTVAVAIQNERRFIGIDIRMSEINKTKRRIRQAVVRKGFNLE